ncbi:MAG: T9SS type A sorting domain-containing protein [Saprospiraceae bacterium]
MLFLLLVWLLQINPITAQGQGDYHFLFDFDNRLHEWVQGPDGAWFGAVRGLASPSYERPYVIKWDAKNDDILWSKQLSLSNLENIREMQILPDANGGVYIGAVYEACDFPTPEGLARMDAAGKLLWVVTTPIEHQDNERLWLVPSANGNVGFQTDKHKFVYSPDGTLLSMSNTGFTWNGLVKNNLGGYLAYGNQAIGSSNPFFSVPFPDNILHAVQAPSGEWYCLGTNKLYRLNGGLDIVAEKPLLYSQSWSKVFWADEACWVTGENSSGESVIQRFESGTLNVVATYGYDKQYRVLSIIHTPGDSLLWLSGECNFPRNQGVFLKSAPTTNPEIVAKYSMSLTDIGLTNPSQELSPPHYCPPFGPYVTNVEFGQLHAIVKNTGSEPISEFVVMGRYTSCWYGCPIEKHFAWLKYMFLEPGESKGVQLEQDFYLLQEMGTTSVDLCFWTNLPNGHLDGIPEDDRLCKTITLIVSDDEPVADAPTVRVMPNPAGEQATFFLEDQATEGKQHRIVVTNASGQIVRQEAFFGQNWVLERGDLPAGLYFYQLTTQCGAVQSGKLVLDR